MKIATKTGDEGTTGLLFGKRLSKAADLFDIVGTLDELSAFLGVAKHHICSKNSKYQDLISKIQKDLILIMGEFSAGDEITEYITKFGSITHADLLIIDKEVEFLQDLPELVQKDWVLYGNSLCGAHLDVCSKVCRRAERYVWKYCAALKNTEAHQCRPTVLQYINRLSDLLYLLARYFDFFHKVS